MSLCRVCAGPVETIFNSPPRSILNITHPVAAATVVSACRGCGHGQSADIDFRTYYGEEYRFQLGAEDLDQLLAVVDGQPVYRTDRQAEIALQMLDLSPGRRLLDYGAAKAATLRKICARRPGLVPHVFDVSDDYRPLWDGWLPRAQQAVDVLPEHWHGTFDVVQSFFVLEHVACPVDTLRVLADMLAPDGQLLLIVPNPLENASDFVVLEHVSHFTLSSLTRALDASGLAVDSCAPQALFGAHVVVARKRAVPPGPVDAAGDFARLSRLAEDWTAMQRRLRRAAERHAGRPSAIYGASVYGCYIATRLEGAADLRAFVDRNPHMWGASEFGIPVLSPDRLPPEVEVVYAGVNPLKAREILSAVPEWRGRSLDIVYLDREPT